MSIILASQSPRRKELLGLLNIPFTIRVADIDETMDSAKDPALEVVRVSRLKAQAIEKAPTDTVIAADTIVVCDGRVLGKPADAADAKVMLQMLSGKVHQVITGLCVMQADRCITHAEVTDVYFRVLTEKEIDDYIQTKDPLDKAGSYGIQSGGAIFVEKIVGDYYNVVGLPVCRLTQILKQIAPDILEVTV